MQYIFNYYRERKIGEKHFLSVDDGSHIILDKDEWNALQQNNISTSLAKKLEEKHIIITEKNVTKIVHKTKQRFNILHTGVSLHIIVVTLRCNMNCIYCHASSVAPNLHEFDMTKETALKTVDTIFESPSHTICIEFQGGELTLNLEVAKHIVKYAKEKNKVAKKNLVFSLVTNMTNMSDELMKYLIDENIGVCTSLDGPEHLHRYNRKYVKGKNYDQVIEWIKKFKEEYKKRNLDNEVYALATITKESLRFPKEIIDQYIKLGMVSIALRPVSRLGTAEATWEYIKFSSEEFQTFWRKGMEYITELRAKGVNIEEYTANIFETKMRQSTDPNYIDIRNPWGGGSGVLTYHYNGDIFASDEGRMLGDDLFKLGNVFESTYTEVTTGEKIKAILAASVNDQYICNTCAYKPYCGLDPLKSYAYIGTPITNVVESDRCKIFKNQFDWVVKERLIKSNRQSRE